MNRTSQEQKTILIVGGAGYIGAHANKAVCEAGYQTVVFDNLSRGCRAAVVKGEFVQGDISNPEDLKNVFSNYSFDAVMHFAALTDVGASIQDPLLYYQSNVSNTLTLLKACVDHNVKTFVFSSSAAVYGPSQEGMINEAHPCTPINPYGQTKLMVEHILHDVDIAYALKSCCLRYFNACGSDPDGTIFGFDRQENNLIPLLFKSLVTGNPPFRLFGTDYPTEDGTCIRDYIHVADLANAHVLALEKLFAEKSSFTYNLGNGRGYSVKEVIKAVENVTGQQICVIDSPRRPGDPVSLLADPKKAKTELAWNPKYHELNEMVLHAWKAFTKTFKEKLKC